jgi:hypothetical protein
MICHHAATAPKQQQDPLMPHKDPSIWSSLIVSKRAEIVDD